MKLRRSDIARVTLWSGSISEKRSITSNGRNATRRAAPGASCVWTQPAATVTAARCSDFGRPINEPGDSNSDLEKARDLPRPQHHAGPYDAPDRIRNVLAVHYGTGLFSACGHEPSYQQSRQRDRKLHFGLLHSERLNGPTERSALDAGQGSAR